MKGHLEDEKASWLAFFACFFSYVIICMTKNTYSSAIAAIVQEGLFTKARAGLINTGFYLFYGAAQFVGGYLADKTSPVKLIIVGLVGSILANIAMSFSQSFTVMLIVWSLNGLIQFGVWPSILKIISTVVMPEHKTKSMKYISFAYCTGMMLSYGITMPVLHFGRWPNLFVGSVIMLVLTLLFFVFSMSHVKTKMLPDEVSEAKGDALKPRETQPDTVSMKKLMLRSGLLFLLLPALIYCMLDLGVMSWVPTMIMESYGVSPGSAGVLTTVLLFVNLSGVFLIDLIYPRRVKNICVAIAVFFVAALPLLALLLLLGRLPLFIIILLLASITTFMQATSQLFNVHLPTVFAQFGKTGLVAGILNAFACFGNMIASYLFGALAEHFGWSATIGSWVGLAFVSMLMLLLAAPIWARFLKNNS